MNANKQLPSLTNGAFLAVSGLVVLLARGVLLNPVSRIILAVLAAGWGVYLLIKGSESRTAGITSLVASGILLVFGGLLSGISTIAGIGLIIAGGVSFFSTLFGNKS